MAKQKHITLDIFDYSRKKLCSLFDSTINAKGQAYDISVITESNGWKEIEFSLPYLISQARNFRWNFIKSEYYVRYSKDGKTDWFIIHAPKRLRNAKAITNTVRCSHISAELKTKNLYLTFDDTNGIDTAPNLLDRALKGTGWTRGECDTFFESDGKTEKIRSMKSEGKAGAYKLITTICDLFNAYPDFDGENKKVSLRSMNNRGALRELVVGKNINTLSVEYNSEDIITRLYVEGEYGDFGYVGIDDINPTGLNFLLDFGYYKEIGMFTNEHQRALDTYIADMKRSTSEITAQQTTLNEKETSLNRLWGQISYVIYRLSGGNVADMVIGGMVPEEKEAISPGDKLVVFDTAWKYKHVTVSDTSTGLTSGNPYAIKFILPASGQIGAAEVSVEAKERLIESLSKKITDDGTGRLEASAQEQIAKQEAEIDELYNGNDEIPGLYAYMKQALDLALEVNELTAQKDAKLFEREGFEAVFTDAMGSMLKDGYWNNSNYTVGQEQFLYDDAVSLMNEMCYPSVTYTVSKAALKDDAEPFMQYRIYDPELGVNDVVHVKKVVSHPDDESKDSVEITNESLSLRSVSFDSIQSRMTQLTDLINQKNALFSRAESIDADGSIAMERLNGQVNILKNQLSSVISSWYTDANGNIIFESTTGKSAMMLTGDGFMIASGKMDDGTWNWRTFGTGEGFTADALITGYLSADRIAANTITANKQASDVGQSLDLSSNESIVMLVEKAFETDSAIEKQGSSIEQIGSQIDAKVWKSDITASVEGKADTSWVESEISSQVNQSAESVTYKFMQSLSETNNLLTQHKTEVSAYQRFSEEGLELGRSDSPLKAKLSNEKLAFEHNGVEVAYISNQKMYITEANVTDKLSVGNENGVCFEWRTTRGGIGLKWIGKI